MNAATHRVAGPAAAAVAMVARFADEQPEYLRCEVRITDMRTGLVVVVAIEDKPEPESDAG